MSPVLPPGLSREKFTAALDEFRGIVGEKYVHIENEALSRYRDPHPVGEFPADGASAAVSPANTKQVRDVVRVANTYGVPLFPVATGRNLGYGGGQPRLPGAVVVDTGERMNRILEVNEKYGYALLEPGVTYFDLYEYLQANAPTLMLDCPDLGWGSPVGNTLERGMGYTPYGDHVTWQSGMEVVLPTGDVMRTGLGALPGSGAWQLFPYGFGPYPDGMFTQSNLGIVTKMGVALMRRPAASTTFLITFPEEEDLAEVIDIVLPLRINMTPLQNVPMLRNIVLDAGVVSRREEWHDGDGPLPPEAIADMKRTLGLGHWNLYGTIYGPPAVMDMYLAIVRQAFRQVRGSRFYTEQDRGPDDRGAQVLHDRHRINNGVPTLEAANLTRFIPNGGHLTFSPVSAPDGEDALHQSRTVRAHAEAHGRDYAAQFVVGLREMHHIAMFLFDTEDPAARGQTLDLVRRLIDEAAAAGYGEYRTHNALMDHVMNTYDWNGGALRTFHETVKDALDPNSIIAPGKSGIWGRKYRGKSL